MTYTAEERKFWAEAFFQTRMDSGDARAAKEADHSLAAYRERFGSGPETPDSSPDETGEAIDAFCKALSHAQISRAAAATSFFTRRGSTFCVRVSRVDADEAASPAPSQPDFSGEPEPITEDVMQQLGMRLYARVWRTPGGWNHHFDLRNRYIYAEITDARKLRAIMEIVRS